jgi:hypothetical protein
VLHFLYLSFCRGVDYSIFCLFLPIHVPYPSLQKYETQSLCAVRPQRPDVAPASHVTSRPFTVSHVCIQYIYFVQYLGCWCYEGDDDDTVMPNEKKKKHGSGVTINCSICANMKFYLIFPHTFRFYFQRRGFSAYTYYTYMYYESFHLKCSKLDAFTALGFKI